MWACYQKRLEVVEIATATKLTSKIANKNVDDSVVCTMCGKKYSKAKGNFRPSKSPLYAHTGYLPICMSCMEKLLRKYNEEYDDEFRAWEKVCSMLDIYYSIELHKIAKGGRGIDFLIGSYYSRLNLWKKEDKKTPSDRTYDDTVKEKEEDQNTAIETFDDFIDAKNAGETKVSRRAITAWGFGFDPEDYDFLENSFADWKARVVIEGKVRETLVRDLCVLKLQQNKALLNKDIKLFNDLSTQYQKTLGTANLQPKQEDANEKSGEKPIGVMIQMFENERPIPKPDPEWEDVDGIARFITVYFLGHMCKMLGIRNKYAKMYEDEMEKYRVEVPELSDAEEDDIFSYIVDGGGKDGEN